MLIIGLYSGTGCAERSWIFNSGNPVIRQKRRRGILDPSMPRRFVKGAGVLTSGLLALKHDQLDGIRTKRIG